MKHKCIEADLPLVHRYGEAWLTEAVNLFRPWFYTAGYNLPKVSVVIGFTTYGDRHLKKEIYGQCLSRDWSVDEITNHIIISPHVQGGIYALDVLGHELIHAVDDCKHSHGNVFHEIANQVKHPDSKVGTLRDMKDWFDFTREMLMQLGRYPGGQIKLL